MSSDFLLGMAVGAGLLLALLVSAVALAASDPGGER